MASPRPGFNTANGPVRSRRRNHPVGRFFRRRDARHIELALPVRDSQRLQHLERAGHDVLCLRLNQFVVQPGAQLAAIGAAVADPSLGAGEPGGDRAFRQTLQIDRRIEAQRAKLFAQLPDCLGGLQPAARDDDHFVERRMPLQQLASATFDDPAQKGVRKLASQCAGRGHGVQHVADGARVGRSRCGEQA